MEELKTASEKGDQELSEQKRTDLGDALDEIPDIVKYLIHVENSMYIARSNGDFVTADKINGLWKELINAYKNQDFDTVNRVIAGMTELLDKAYKDTGVTEENKDIKDDRLTRSQMPSSSGIKAASSE